MPVPGIRLTRFAAKCLSQLVLDLFTVGICLVGGWDICAGETEVFASIIIWSATPVSSFDIPIGSLCMATWEVSQVEVTCLLSVFANSHGGQWVWLADSSSSSWTTRAVFNNPHQMEPSVRVGWWPREKVTRKAGDLGSSPSEYQIFNLFRFENITGSKTAVSVCTLWYLMSACVIWNVLSVCLQDECNLLRELSLTQHKKNVAVEGS